MAFVDEKEVWRFMSTLIINKVTSGVPLELSVNFPSDQSIMLRYTHHDEGHINKILSDLTDEINILKREASNPDIKFSYEIQDKSSMFQWPLFKDWNFSPMNIYFFVTLEKSDNSFLVTDIARVTEESEFNAERARAQQFYNDNKDKGLFMSIIAQGKEKLLIIDLHDNPEELIDVVFNKVYNVLAQFIYKHGRDAEGSYEVPCILIKKRDGIKGLVVNSSAQGVEASSVIERNSIVTPVNLVVFKRKGFLSNGLFNIDGREHALYSVIPAGNTRDLSHFSFGKFYKRTKPLLGMLRRNTRVDVELKREEENIFVNRLFAEYIFKEFEEGYK